MVYGLVLIIMDNKQKILEISKKLKLSHIGSCLSVLPILEEIYAKKKPEDKVLLCGGHSHLAHLVIKDRADEKEDFYPSLNLIEEYGIHCERAAGCDSSAGSLGHQGGIAIGLAIANPDSTIYLIDTDGSLQEGSCWEAYRIMKELKIKNIKCIVNMNGFTALQEIDKEELTNRLKAFCPDIDIRYTNNGEGFEGIAGHYKVLEK